MAGLWSGLTQGDWSDDPMVNRQRQSGALLGAASAIDTYGKTGGRLLQDALLGYMNGSQGERGMQLKERVADADIKYKNSLGVRDQQEHAFRVQSAAKDLYGMRMAEWERRVRIPGEDPGPTPRFEDAMRDAMHNTAMTSTTGLGQKMGVGGPPAGQNRPGGVLAPSQAPSPQPGPQTAPTPDPAASSQNFTPIPDGVPPSALFDVNTPSGLRQPEQPPMGGLLKSQGPVMPSRALSAQLNPPGAQPFHKPGPAPQGLLPQANQPQAPMQAPMQQMDGGLAEAQRRAAEVTAYYDRLARYGVVPSKEENAMQEARRGRLIEGQVPLTSGVMAPQVGAAEAKAREAGMVKSAERGSELVKYKGPGGATLEMPRWKFDQINAIHPLITELSPQEVARQQSNPNLMTVPGATPDAPPQLLTEEQIRAGGAAGGGVAAGMSANVEARTKQQEAQYTDRTKEFGKLVAEHGTKSAAAEQTLAQVDTARKIMPATGKVVEATLPMRQWLSSMLKLSPESVEQIWKAEGFTSLMNKALVNTQEAFKGAVSNVEFETAAKTVAQLGNTPQGNKFMLDFMAASARKQQWYAANLAKIQSKHDAVLNSGGDYRGFDFTEAKRRLDAVRDSPEFSLMNESGQFRNPRAQ